MKKFKTLILLFLIVQIPPSVFGQKSEILNNYIKEGLTQNATLKTAQFDIARSLHALEQAKTLFMPRVDFQMQYTLAVGGRTQELPVGDLLNPVYGTLNQLTRTNNFPNIENAQINFLPNNFHDTKIHAVYPILNKEIVYNRDIKKELISVEQAKVNVYKRELVKNIKIAYLQYLQASEAVQIYKNALSLVQENQRLNEKLVKNNVATSAVVIKAQAEVAKVENSIVETENQAKNAAAYFNFLLNKPFDTPILMDSTISKAVNPQFTPPQYILQNREEFAQISGGEKALTLQKQMHESYKTPKIGAFLDAGFQGFGFKIWDKQAYAIGGAQLEIPLYSAGANKMKGQATQIELQKLAAQRDEIAQQIELQIRLAQTNLTTAQQALKVNAAELSSLREYYRLTERRYREGQALQIELTDARTQLTTAELKRSLAEYTILLKMVELERADASFQF
jgi:outer membrane protein